MRKMIMVLAAAMLATMSLAAEYYVSASGDDANAGTMASPWRTVAKAGATAGPGDTVWLGAGAYRETLRPHGSGAAGKPVRFVALPGAKVVLSGTEPLVGSWQVHTGSIYKLQTSLKFIQLFADGRMMPEARWPNSPPDDLMSMERAAAAAGTGYETLVDPRLPPGDWNGAVVILWPGSEWINMTRRVADYQPGKSFRFDVTTEAKVKDEYHKDDPYKPRAGNPYLLVGALAGLDRPGEWFLDEKTGTVYLWAPDGKDPGRHNVEVKQRTLAVDLDKLAFVEIKGVEILGAAVSLRDAQDCTLEDCRLRYVEHIREYPIKGVPDTPNRITGKRNTLRHCLIAYGATTALNMSGESNALFNCVVHDANYLGSGHGGLDLRGAVGAKVEHCTVFRAGRDTIQHGNSKRISLQYNDVYDGNMLNHDAGAIYCWGTDGQGGIIAYNWVHDNPRCNGIYLDGFSKNFIVHHNVVWNCGGNAFHINGPDAFHHLVYNNTISETGDAFGTCTFSGYAPTMKGTRIINNLVNEVMHPENPEEFVQGELGPELAHNAPGAVDKDGYPTANSAAIDAGMVIEGITDGYKGKAPDLGAYEFDGPHWVAGADWRDPEAPAAPARSLAYTPRAPITFRTMITNGLVLWFDAADKATLELNQDGRVLAWHDKSPQPRVAMPVQPQGGVKWVADGMNGKGVVRGNGTGSLRVADLQRGPGAVTVLVVAQALEAVGPTWQRIIANYAGAGQEWVWPNWMIGVPGGKNARAWPAQVFTIRKRAGMALGTITLLGSSEGQGQTLGGDIGEVLVFDRVLRFEEMEALQKYFVAKWGVME